MTQHHGTEPYESERPQRKDSAFVRFARDYGWRAYAIPVLAVITIFLIFDVLRSPDEPALSTDQAARETQVSASEDQPAEQESKGPGPDPAQSPLSALAIEDLPPGSPYSEKGDGTYRVVGKPGMSAGEGEESTMTFVVEIENGVDTSAYGGDDAFASMVDATLSDPRGWTNDSRFKFEHVGPDDDPEMRIQLTSVETTKELCGANLGMETSCRTTLGGGNTVVVNEARWVRGAVPFQGDLGSYRQYLLNHEVGHGLGYAAHVPCGDDGELAPIMMQQTLSLNNSELFSIDPTEVYPDDQKTCRANPWPYPRPNAQ
ncbi:DUF3152 domain-containing protein [Corynebacterium breve]|uniref:DUF3152 domain-containing protein n=1 Tax=Corynebacterium breve TaxID=3049799 RepID=A0ABY8VL76_9CORY|nr:DUF3152 domain-containing protein [Corynebacterium breve]WIM68300.1 DUF3152 domain-containing protein [Corynebacterium breve]